MGRIRASRGVRPDAYLIVAAGQPLYAPTLEQLAEIAECAIVDGLLQLGLLRLLRRVTGTRWAPTTSGRPPA